MGIRLAYKKVKVTWGLPSPLRVNGVNTRVLVTFLWSHSQVNDMLLWLQHVYYLLHNTYNTCIFNLLVTQRLQAQINGQFGFNKVYRQLQGSTHQ